MASGQIQQVTFVTLYPDAQDIPSFSLYPQEII